MKNNEIVKNVFYQATEFIDLVESKYYNPKNDFSIIPVYINALFAMELLLKAMLLYDGEDLKNIKNKNHHLKDLYEMLNEKRKTIIDNEMKSFFNTNILELLDEINNDFVEVRYMYLENKTKVKKINFHNLCQFMYHLHLQLSYDLFGYDYYKKFKSEKIKYLVK